MNLKAKKRKVKRVERWEISSYKTSKFDSDIPSLDDNQRFQKQQKTTSNRFRQSSSHKANLLENEIYDIENELNEYLKIY